jgi:ribosomal protein S7
MATTALTSTGKLFTGFLGCSIKKGFLPERALAHANARLKLKYQIDNPIQVAIEAVKPILRHPPKLRSPTAHPGLPTVLSPRDQYRVAVKWILAAVRARKYEFDCRNFEKGLFDEISAIFDGTSSVYAKRFQYHKGN